MEFLFKFKHIWGRLSCPIRSEVCGPAGGGDRQAHGSALLFLYQAGQSHS